MKGVEERNKKNSKAYLLIILGWLVYSTSYLGKVNYSANITQIIDFFGVTKAQAGVALTFFFFAYGIGQVFNGIFCKKYNIKFVVFASLAVSAAINFIIAVVSDFSIVKWLWLINGFVLSILWPALIRLLSEALPRKALSTSSVVMGTTTAAGTLVVYGLSSLFAAFDKFKLAFYVAAFAEAVVALVWLGCYKAAVETAKADKEEEKCAAKQEKVLRNKGSMQKSEAKIFYAVFFILCICAVAVNLTKDGLTTWVPSILKEEFSMNDSLSIFLTLFLPILALFGNIAALKIHRKIPDYVSQCGATFVVALVFIGVIIYSLHLRLVVFMLAGLIIVNFLVSSLNSLVTTIYPMFVRDKINSGFCAGLINGFCYLGSTISAYGLGVVADRFGWLAVFLLLIGVCAAICIIWGGYTLFKRALKVE